jgi:hypothetical protein
MTLFPSGHNICHFPWRKAWFPSKWAACFRDTVIRGSSLGCTWGKAGNSDVEIRNRKPQELSCRQGHKHGEATATLVCFQSHCGDYRYQAKSQPRSKVDRQKVFPRDFCLFVSVWCCCGGDTGHAESEGERSRWTCRRCRLLMDTLGQWSLTWSHTLASSLLYYCLYVSLGEWMFNFLTLWLATNPWKMWGVMHLI